jgi:hypothetical protein
MDLIMMERVGDRWEKMEGYCSTAQSPHWAVMPMEEERRRRCFLNKGTRLAYRSKRRTIMSVFLEEGCVISLLLISARFTD